MLVEGDYRLQQRLETEGYAESTGQLVMTNDADYVLVQGDFVMQSRRSHDGQLTAGVLEVKGDFTQLTTSYAESRMNFLSTDAHKVLLSGQGQQIITFASALSGFNTLMHANSEVLFNGYVRIVQPEQFQLLLKLGGEGQSSIVSADEKLLCGSQCSAFYPRGEVVILSTAMVRGDVFNGWPEPCTVVDEHCQITVDSRIALELSFAPKPAKNRRKSKLMLMIVAGQANQ